MQQPQPDHQVLMVGMCTTMMQYFHSGGAKRQSTSGSLKRFNFLIYLSICQLMSVLKKGKSKKEFAYCRYYLLFYMKLLFDIMVLGIY